MWPRQIRTRTEDLMLRIVLSVFATYLSALVIAAARFVA